MRTVGVTVAMLASLAGCGDDGSAGGAGTGGGAPNEWATYCAEVYCPQRAEQAAATGCDSDPQCEAGCELLAEECHPQVEAVQVCAASATLQCYETPDGPRVDLSPGQCAAELNDLFLCDEGACNTFDDAPCAPLECEDGSIVRYCDAGACSSSAASACDDMRACTTDDFVDVCPTIACDGASQQGCLPSGLCQVSCE